MDYFFSVSQIILTLILIVFVWFISCYISTIKAIIVTTPRDMKCLYRLCKAQISTYYHLWRNHTILNFAYNHAKSRPNDVALIAIGGRQYTYGEFESISNKIAIYFEKNGFMPGSCIGILMDSSPEYVISWYGLGKIKVISSFLNTHLTCEQLKYVILKSNCRGIIFSKKFEEIIGQLELDSLNLYCYDGTACLQKCINLQEAFADIKEHDVYPRAVGSDTLCYVFTSGTTGMPKPVVIRHTRVMGFVELGMMCKSSRSDRIYCFLPFYHALCGLAAVGIAFKFGSTLIIRQKFSASNFITDCINYKVNSFVYIGEICRYLTNLPATKNDKLVRFKYILGNGMRKNVWSEMIKKYNIDNVYEFYGSTEGSVRFINVDNHLGACGCVPVYLFDKLPYKLVKCNEDGEISLNDYGYPTVCQPGEVGHLIGKIVKNFHLTTFDGYVDKKETSLKIRTDLFQEGDRYFLSGDLLSSDEYGYLYFYDRVGDTYRWKGENVSTTEIETYFIKFPEIKEAVSYGVKVPGTEGKAGMLAVELIKKFVPEDFDSYVKRLPPFQIPLFIRVVPQTAMTDTMKFIKRNLKDEAYDLRKVKDPLYFYDKNRGYVPLTMDIYDEILSGMRTF